MLSRTSHRYECREDSKTLISLKVHNSIKIHAWKFTRARSFWLALKLLEGYVYKVTKNFSDGHSTVSDRRLGKLAGGGVGLFVMQLLTI